MGNTCDCQKEDVDLANFDMREINDQQIMSLHIDNMEPEGTGGTKTAIGYPESNESHQLKIIKPSENPQRHEFMQQNLKENN